MAHFCIKIQTLAQILVLLTMVKFTVTARLLATAITTNGSPTIVSLLKLGDTNGGSTKCWDSLFELQSCTGEVILFFLNGETYLGAGCCAAIEKIERQCLPTLLGSLGITSEEGDVLRGYCDASSNGGFTTTATTVVDSVIPSATVADFESP